jgi:XTP/dITP diphosphohydrolase
MPDLLFATNNANKIREIREGLPPIWNIIGLKEAGINVEIPEPHQTLQENAAEKAITIFKMTGIACFSEDTGLEVDALNGAPGVHSARYAGEDGNAQANMEKLLHNLKGVDNRSARFRTVISLMWNGEPIFFEGICPGQIATTPRGEGGFGYDPIFIPDGSNLHFAEMPMTEKNKFSHRKKALHQLLNFLQNHG